MVRPTSFDEIVIENLDSKVQPWATKLKEAHVRIHSLIRQMESSQDRVRFLQGQNKSLEILALLFLGERKLPESNEVLDRKIKALIPDFEARAERLKQGMSDPAPPPTPVFTPGSAAEEFDKELDALRSSQNPEPEPKAGEDDLGSDLGLQPGFPCEPRGSYTERIYLVFPSTLTSEQTETVWSRLESFGGIVNTRFMSQGAGIEFTLDLGFKIMRTSDLERELEAKLTALAPDRLRIEPKIRLVLDDPPPQTLSPPGDEGSQSGESRSWFDRLRGKD